jgi:Cu/Ag efflux protein CusF
METQTVPRGAVGFGMAIVLSVSMGACGKPSRRSEPQGQTASLSPHGQQRYDLRGKVTAVDKSGKRLTVDHEDIPGFMAAMTMAYSVKDEHLLEGVAPGDQVTAQVVAEGNNVWLERVEVTTKAPTLKATDQK